MAANNIPENADKLLFAEDLVRYMMLRNAHVEYVPWRAGPYREFIYNGFNEVTKLAVRFLDSTMEMRHDDIFHFMRNANVVNTDTYMRFARDIALKYFHAGFDANNFLHYCVHLANLAAYFHNNGITEAPSLAVLYIADAFQNFDMTAGGWETINRISEMYASMAQDSMNTLSPKSVGSEDDPAPNISTSSDDNENGGGPNNGSNDVAKDPISGREPQNLDRSLGSKFSGMAGQLVGGSVREVQTASTDLTDQESSESGGNTLNTPDDLNEERSNSSNSIRLSGPASSDGNNNTNRRTLCTRSNDQNIKRKHTKDPVLDTQNKGENRLEEGFSDLADGNMTSEPLNVENQNLSQKPLDIKIPRSCRSENNRHAENRNSRPIYEENRLKASPNGSDPPGSPRYESDRMIAETSQGSQRVSFGDLHPGTVYEKNHLGTLKAEGGDGVNPGNTDINTDGSQENQNPSSDSSCGRYSGTDYGKDHPTTANAKRDDPGNSCFENAEYFEANLHSDSSHGTDLENCFDSFSPEKSCTSDQSGNSDISPTANTSPNTETNESLVRGVFYCDKPLDLRIPKSDSKDKKDPGGKI